MGWIKDISNAISSFLLGDTKEKIGKLIQGFEDMRIDLGDLKKDFKEFQDDLMTQGRKVEYLNGKISNFVQAKSPLRLNDLGKGVLNQSGLGKIIDENKDRFINLIKQQDPQTALDAQKQCILLFNSPNIVDLLKPVKDFVYHHPEFQGKPLNMGHMEIIGGLYLRDRYFEKYSKLISKKESKK